MTSINPCRRVATSLTINVRGLNYRIWRWGDPSLETSSRPALWLLHGWMDVGASFQFAVDALAHDRCIYAPDWRGFGLSDCSASDTYWFPDYLADFDALLDALSPGRAVDIAGHSMGGNVAMLYAGARPERVRRLMNLEGFGLPDTHAAKTPQHYARWMDSLKVPRPLKTYASLDEVAERLRRNNPRLTANRAAWLAPHWAARRDDGRWHVLGDPSHKRPSGVPYRADEVLACWAQITAPVLWVEGRQTEVLGLWRQPDARATVEERITRLAHVERAWLDDCGHMLQHDQPEAVATLIERFLEQDRAQP